MERLNNFKNNFKIVCCGDIHGRNSWKKIVEANPDADLFVFIGDYFDSFDVTPVIQKHNFKEILDFKRANPTKVILLIGNHDFHYLRGSVNQYTGYQGVQRWDFQELLDQATNENLIQMCFKYDKYLFTHAGVTKTWAKNYEIDLNDVENELNYLFERYKQSFDFQMGPNCSIYGEDVTQSPIWVRPVSLKQDRLDGYIQVVGHTNSSYIDFDFTNKVIVCDTLNANKYLIIDISEHKSDYHEKLIN